MNIHLQTSKEIVCHICDEKVSSVTVLKAHVLIHSGNKVKTCQVCHGRYADINKHVKTHYERKLDQTCTVCTKSFYSREVLLHHQKIHDKKKATLKCNVCMKAFSSKCGLRSHKLNHTGGKLKTCQICNESVTNISAHLARHNKDRPIHKCDRCDRTYLDKSNLYSHMRKVHLKDGESIILNGHIIKQKRSDQYKACGVCGRKYHPDFIKRHKESHSKEKQKCPQCSKEVKHIKQHLEWFHGETKRDFVCAICQKTCSSRENLKKHSDIHTGKNLKQCPECNGWFAGIYNHMNTHHRQNSKHKVVCPTCKKGYASSHVLKQHLKTHEKNRTRYHCKTCGKSLSTAGHLHRHSLIHSGKNIKTCAICNRKVADLPDHMKSHMNLKLPCLMYGKLFKTKGTLRQHRKTHTNKAHKCHICGKEVKRLYAHMKCKHPKQSPTSPSLAESC